jgi:hypothetical protein
MNYVNFFDMIVIPHKINLIGWPCNKFVNPSELSDSLPPLLELRDCLVEGSCYFKKLSDREFQDLANKHQKAIDAGEILPMKRKVWKDKNTGTDSTAQIRKAKPAKKQINAKKSVAIVEGDSESDDAFVVPDDDEEAEVGSEDGDGPAPSQIRSLHEAATASSTLHSAIFSDPPNLAITTPVMPSPSSSTTTLAPLEPGITCSSAPTEISESSRWSPLGDITRAPSVNQTPPSTTAPASDLPAKRVHHAPVHFGWHYPEDGGDLESNKRPAKRRKAQK